MKSPPHFVAIGSSATVIVTYNGILAWIADGTLGGMGKHRKTLYFNALCVTFLVF
jgi:hypothetical protein